MKFQEGNVLGERLTVEITKSYIPQKVSCIRQLIINLLPCNIKTRCNGYLQQLKAVVGWKLPNGYINSMCLIMQGSSINHKQNLSQYQLIFTDGFQLPVILYSLHYWIKSNNYNLAMHKCMNFFALIQFYWQHISLGKWNNTFMRQCSCWLLLNSEASIVPINAWLLSLTNGYTPLLAYLIMACRL